MSNRELDEMALKHTCPHCGEAPTKWCRTISGSPSPELHSKRTHIVFKDWWAKQGGSW